MKYLATLITKINLDKQTSPGSTEKNVELHHEVLLC